MENKDDLNPFYYLVAQGHDGSNSMLGALSGVRVRTIEKHLQATENQCLCHTASLSCKSMCNKITVMNNFQQHTHEMLNLIKKSPHREHALESHKKVAPKDKLNEEPSKIGKIISWNPVRMTDNFRPMDSVKKTIHIHIMLF